MPTTTGWRRVVSHLAIPGAPTNRVLRLGLACLALVITIHTSWLITSDGLPGVDLEIPLRAAARFAAGGQPYLASAFLVQAGPGLPYLYPPYLLPFLVPFLILPRLTLLMAWVVVCLIAATFACRRLAIPMRVVPLVVIWPAFWEGIWHGNAQILIFAAFMVLFFDRPAKAAEQPVDRRIDRAQGSLLRDGLLAVGIAVVKPSEGWPWLNVLRRHPRAAVVGALAIVGLVVVTLPLVGVDRWLAYVEQAARAADPGWIDFGAGPAHFVSGWPTMAITVATLVLALVVPRQGAGAWLGLLAVVGAPTLRGYELIFLLPALLRIRREAALIVATLVATFAVPAIWLAVAVTAVLMLLSLRNPAVLEYGASANGPPPPRAGTLGSPPTRRRP